MQYLGINKFHLRNEFDFWNVHGIICIHDCMNRPKIENINYIYIFSIEIIYNLGDKTVLYFICNCIKGV